jgi:predicted HTH domain antitoxin
MPITIDIPKAIEEQLAAGWGSDLPRAVKEALAAEGYRSGLLSVGQVAELLDRSIDAADGFLKSRGIPLPYAAEDLERDLASLAQTLGQ